ncbi:DUF2497 domain-containing protein [Brevundimonas sp.]|uniref:DUF2497 domain-containing protein n=1 Tax=Brevundimonas sp. TaxID=1871086 RepID=UPI0028A23610|nr:DUF2497 domain-containing protein [Brevundimonas sp.]
MTDQSAQEPTMEEILASIRRIISEDEAPAETPASAAPEGEVQPEPAPEPAAAETVFAAPFEPEPAPAAEDDVLELTDRYDAAPVETIGDLDVTPTETYQAPEPPAVPPAREQGYDTLVGDSAAASAASAFAGLAASFKKPEPAPAPSTGDLPFVSGNTVEAMVAEMLRPLLKDWLDANLPAIVEAQVRKEVERIARSA